MARKVGGPTVVESVGTMPKRIEELVGAVNTADPRLSIARMRSPAGWEEPGQTPAFDEFTLVISGRLVAEHVGGTIEVGPGEVVHAEAGEWVRYSTPEDTDYLSVCLPAFSPQSVHRDA